MKYPRKEKLEELKDWERKAYIQENIRFNWFIDEHTLLDSLIHLKLFHTKSNYLVDHDFEKYVFRDVTLSDARYIASKLYQDAYEKEKRWCEKFKITFNVDRVWCSKSRYILSCLDSENKHDFWIESPNYLLGYVRRIQCGCHETGSFAKRKD